MNFQVKYRVSIRYITGEIIDNHHQLLSTVQSVLKDMVREHLKFLIIDEVTYINDWDKAIKFAADGGLFENTVVIITLTILSQKVKLILRLCRCSACL